MTDISYQSSVQPQTTAVNADTIRAGLLAAAAFVAVAALLMVALRYQTASNDDPLFANSTPGLLAVWMAGQSAVESPASVLGQYSRNWAVQTGAESLEPDILLSAFRRGLVGFCLLFAALGVVGLVGALTRARWRFLPLVFALLGLNALLFIVPPIDDTLTILLGSITVLALSLLFVPKKVNRIVGFVVILSLLLVAWEGMKAAAESVGYSVTVPLESWEYTTFPDLDGTLAALDSGEINAVIVDRRDVIDLVPLHPARGTATPDEFAYPNLRILDRFDMSEQVFLFPVRPALPGRLRVVVRAEDAGTMRGLGMLTGQSIGAVSGEFADERFLAAPREMRLLDLRIFTDINLPHLQSISAALWQPARRNGPLLLFRILLQAGLYTWGEAVVGFGMGATFGFVLGTALAHSRILQRGLLPYVVASQTIPILALAPMVVIWLGAGPFAVAVIASYLTFFPVTINTLRGLRSPDPMKVELMRSYAASSWAIMWKLRFPAALPYIFTALKVSATASVVGAIIGELPSSVRDGLGRAILDFSSDYSLISTPKLWGAIFVAALVGITFFLIVSAVEWVVLRNRFAK